MEAVELAELTGLELDEWQQTALYEMAALRAETYWNPFTAREENKWAATEFGLMVSRQNGKGSILEARELAGLFVWGERLIIHSAHLFPTAVEAFERVLMLIENTPELDRQVARVVRSHGDEGIHLKKPRGQRITGQGQRLLFKARSGGGGRGFTADCIVFDEAMMKLASAEIKALLPTLSARPNPQIIYTGSAGDQDSEQFGRIRNRAVKVLKGQSVEPKMTFLEWSAELCDFTCPPGCDRHDNPAEPRTWAKANPAYGIRVSEEWIRETEMPSFGGALSPAFHQERLGVGDWPADGEAWHVFPEDSWTDRGRPESKLVKGEEFALAIDTSQDSKYTAIGVCGIDQHDDFHIELTGTPEHGPDYRPGIHWAIPRLIHLAKTKRVPFVIMPKDSPIGAYIEQVESEGITVISPSQRDFALACGDFKSSVAPRAGERARVTHISQAPVTAAAAGAERRDIADLWVLSKKESGADITALTVLVHAFWGYKKHIYTKRAQPWVFFD